MYIGVKSSLKMANYYFVIVGHSDNPLFELEYAPKPPEKSSDKSADGNKVRSRPYAFDLRPIFSKWAWHK